MEWEVETGTGYKDTWIQASAHAIMARAQRALVAL